MGPLSYLTFTVAALRTLAQGKPQYERWAGPKQSGMETTMATHGVPARADVGQHKIPRWVFLGTSRKTARCRANASRCPVSQTHMWDSIHMAGGDQPHWSADEVNKMGAAVLEDCEIATNLASADEIQGWWSIQSRCSSRGASPSCLRVHDWCKDRSNAV